MNESVNPGIASNKGRLPAVRLIDCFMEIISYTLYLIDGLEKSQPDFDSVYADYGALLKRSGKMAQRSRITSGDWKKACFPVCAWVDEKIMCSSWEEKSRWQQHQLQLKFFQTTMAGREFFNRLEKLKENDREIREVYTYCLALGYTGQYYADDDQLQLSEIKVENLLKYFSEDQEMNLPEELFPEACQNRASGRPRPKFPGVSVSAPNVVFFLLPPLVAMGAYAFYFVQLQDLLKNIF